MWHLNLKYKYNVYKFMQNAIALTDEAFERIS